MGTKCSVTSSASSRSRPISSTSSPSSTLSIKSVFSSKNLPLLVESDIIKDKKLSTTNELNSSLGNKKKVTMNKTATINTINNSITTAASTTNTINSNNKLPMISNTSISEISSSYGSFSNENNTKVSDITPDIPRMLTFDEYRQWLQNRRNNGITTSPVTSLKQRVRCQTATLRKIIPNSSVCPSLDVKLTSSKQSSNTNSAKVSSTATLSSVKPLKSATEKISSKTFFINFERINGRKSSASNKSSDDSGIFDMNTISKVLPIKKSKSLIRIALNRNRIQHKTPISQY